MGRSVASSGDASSAGSPRPGASPSRICFPTALATCQCSRHVPGRLPACTTQPPPSGTRGPRASAPTDAPFSRALFFVHRAQMPGNPRFPWVTDLLHLSRLLPATDWTAALDRESPFACHRGRFRLGARPFDRAAARVESALQAQPAHSGRFPACRRLFPLPPRRDPKGRLHGIRPRGRIGPRPAEPTAWPEM